MKVPISILVENRDPERELEWDALKPSSRKQKLLQLPNSEELQQPVPAGGQAGDYAFPSALLVGSRCWKRLSSRL